MLLLFLLHKGNVRIFERPKARKQGSQVQKNYTAASKIPTPAKFKKHKLPKKFA